MIKQTRQLAAVISGQNTTDGAGVKLKRIVSQQQKNAFDPFILLDEFGSDEPGDYIGGFPEHPHRGFETVTYMLEGAMLHRDHLGNEGHLRAGDVQWMTAAHGIIHSEMPEQENGLLHGFQLWINLPAREKMKPPHYQEFAARENPAYRIGRRRLHQDHRRQICYRNTKNSRPRNWRDDTTVIFQYLAKSAATA